MRVTSTDFPTERYGAVSPSIVNTGRRPLGPVRSPRDPPSAPPPTPPLPSYAPALSLPARRPRLARQRERLLSDAPVVVQRPLRAPAAAAPRPQQRPLLVRLVHSHAPAVACAARYRGLGRESMFLGASKEG